MNPLYVLLALGGVGAYFLMKDDDKKPVQGGQNGGIQQLPVPAVMSQIPQWAQLPPSVQQQVAAVLAGGNKDQILVVAKQLDAQYGPQVKPVTDVLRSVAAMKL